VSELLNMGFVLIKRRCAKKNEDGEIILEVTTWNKFIGHLIIYN
jgi:hypothetical protein